MPPFAQWLYHQTSTDPELRYLKAYADNHAATWPWWSDDKTDYEQHVNSNEVDPANNTRLKDALNRYFEIWSSENRTVPNAPIKQQLVGFLEQNVGGIVLSIFFLILFMVLIWGLFNTRFFTSIAGIEQARGLITFLFAFSTMGIIVLIAVAIFWLDQEELNERFSRAKDLLTIIIGILGTILGFYFGSLTAGETRALNIANVGVSSPVAQPSSTVKISATILGGTPPYTYSIQFTDPTGAANTSTMTVKTETSDTGAIAKDVVIPTDVSKSTGITFTMIANDAKGAQAHASSAIVVAPKAAQ
jgi:hypothetical protein